MVLQITEHELPTLGAHDIGLYLARSPELYMSLKAAGDCGPSGLAGDGKRRRFRQEFSRREGPVWCCHQVHSRKVLVLESRGAAWFCETCFDPVARVIKTELALPALQDDWYAWVCAQDCDGIVTDLPVCLGVTGADCLSIALGCGQWRGLLHSGWQGTGILVAALEAMEESRSGTDPLELHFGPSIAWQDYPVPSERAGAFIGLFGPESVRMRADGQPALDIPEANLGLLRTWLSRDGRAPCRASIWRTSTASHPSLHSYRRDQAAFGRSLICLEA